MEVFYGLKGENTHCIMVNTFPQTGCHPCYFTDYVVDPSSVGQYTALKDMNGKPIFEGDIVSQWGGNAVVEYGLFNCSCCDGVYGWYFNDADIRCSDSCTVIGNIHDNPEFLE